jgi:hypothetical protein
MFFVPVYFAKASTSSQLKIKNCVWLLPSNQGLELMNANPTVWQATIKKLEAVNINSIIVWAGSWKSDLSINYADSPSVWTQFIQTAKAIDPNFVVLALVYGSGIDVSSSNNRAVMLDSVKQLLIAAPFDGINDDIEDFSGTTSDAINFWQSEANLLDGMGKIATVDLGVDWSYKIEDVYPYLTNFDYVIPMYYWTIKDPNALSYWNRILNNSAAPVLMGLDVDQNEMKNYALSEQLAWINQTMNSDPHGNLVGFGFWAYDYWDNSGGTSNDFSAWTNWVTKGEIQPLTNSSGPSNTYLIIIFAIVIIAAVIAFLSIVLARRSRKSSALNVLGKANLLIGTACLHNIGLIPFIRLM